MDDVKAIAINSLLWIQNGSGKVHTLILTNGKIVVLGFTTSEMALRVMDLIVQRFPGDYRDYGIGEAKGLRASASSRSASPTVHRRRLLVRLRRHRRIRKTNSELGSPATAARLRVRMVASNNLRPRITSLVKISAADRR